MAERSQDIQKKSPSECLDHSIQKLSKTFNMHRFSTPKLMLAMNFFSLTPCPD